MTELAGPTAPELEQRTGYDPAFLGPGVPMPAVTTGVATVLLRYLHYSVLFRPDRKFAALTALDLDGAHLQAIDRTDNWLLDPRLSPAVQAGPPVYSDNDLDRGHLVMRASSAWGATEAEARQAEAETFYFTNAALRRRRSTRAANCGWGWRSTSRYTRRPSTAGWPSSPVPCSSSTTRPTAASRSRCGSGRWSRSCRTAHWRRPGTSSTRPRWCTTSTRCSRRLPRPARCPRSGSSAHSRCPSPTSPSWRGSTWTS